MVYPPEILETGPYHVKIRFVEPAVPNGNVVEYHLLIDGSDRGTYGNTETLIVDGLDAFTEYGFALRACTEAGCTESRTALQSTAEGRPGHVQTPVPLATSEAEIDVEWAAPLEPNGDDITYRLLQTRLETCPATPSEASGCTYVACAVNEGVCGGRCYDTDDLDCCNGVLQTISKPA